MEQKKRQKQANALCSILSEIRIVLIPLGMFLACAMIAASRNKNAIPVWAYVLLIVSLVFAFASKLVAGHMLPQKLEIAPQRKKEVATVLAVSLLLRLPQWDVLIYNDSAAYYQKLYAACSKFTFGFDYFFENFRLAGHPSYGFALLAAIPEFLFPGSFHNIWLLQTTLSLLAIYCVYDLLSRQKSFRGWRSVVGALTVSVSSMFLGLDSYFQLDFGVAVATIFLIWAFYRRKYILLTASAVLLVFSKEFGITILVGFFLGILIYDLWALQGGSVWNRIFSIFKEPLLIVTGVLCLFLGLAVLWYLFGSGKAWINVSMASQEKDSYAVGYIGWSGDYFGYKVTQLITSNFFWLECLVNIACAIRCKHRQSVFTRTVKTLIAGCIGAMILYFSFSCIIVTYSIDRYNLVLEILLCLITVMVVLPTIENRMEQRAFCSLAVLLAIQAYLTIDPVMLMMNYGVQTDGWPLAYMAYADTDYIGDYAIYNYQYSYMRRCLRKILAQENYDADGALLAVYKSDNGFRNGGNETYFWNPDAKTWTMKIENGVAWDCLATGDNCDALKEGLASSDNKEGKKLIVIVSPLLAKHDYAVDCQDIVQSLSACAHDFKMMQTHDGIYGMVYYVTADIGTS